MALPREVIDFRRAHLRENPAQSRSIGKISVMEKKTVAAEFFLAPQVLDARAEQVTGSPHDAVNHVAFFEQQLRQIRPILTGNTGDQRNFRSVRHGIENMGGGASLVNQ